MQQIELQPTSSPSRQIDNYIWAWKPLYTNDGSDANLNTFRCHVRKRVCSSCASATRVDSGCPASVEAPPQAGAGGRCLRLRLLQRSHPATATAVRPNPSPSTIPTPSVIRRLCWEFGFVGVGEEGGGEGIEIVIDGRGEAGGRDWVGNMEVDDLENARIQLWTMAKGEQHVRVV
jgi:hypothetical protein